MGNWAKSEKSKNFWTIRYRRKISTVKKSNGDVVSGVERPHAMEAENFILPLSTKEKSAYNVETVEDR